MRKNKRILIRIIQLVKSYNISVLTLLISRDIILIILHVLIILIGLHLLLLFSIRELWQLYRNVLRENRYIQRYFW